MLAAWPLCLERLEAELSAEDFHTWVKPLQATPQGHGLALFAPKGRGDLCSTIASPAKGCDA